MWQGDLKRGLQTAVSQNKRRFIDTEAKFDLDLTYICDRMIAMALPCVDGAMYRNDIREVARFFSTRHYGVQRPRAVGWIFTFSRVSVPPFACSLRYIVAE